jgi:hypothetical protein
LTAHGSRLCRGGTLRAGVKAALTVGSWVPTTTSRDTAARKSRSPSATPRSLLGLAARRHAAGVTLVATEATSDAWKPAFSLLEAEGQLLAANTGHLKNLPGRPQTDQLDAVGLAKVVKQARAGPASGRHLLQAMITRQPDQGAHPAGRASLRAKLGQLEKP